MVNKTIQRPKTATKNKRLRAEKNILIMLIIIYISGLCTGSMFVFGLKDSSAVMNYIHSTSIAQIIIYFILILILKYSGFLSCLICIFPAVLGIQNAAVYCKEITNSRQISYTLISAILKDTSAAMLFLLYIIIIITQIVNKKYNIKRDLKYFLVYFIGINIIYIINAVINKIIL